MIESVIANWLTKTNERNYQIPYCQVLLAKGQRVLYVSTHRPMEQGKDIITVDNDGAYHAYQLKTGNIDQKTFRTIKGEVEELVERSIVHPSVDKAKGHRAYLVCNGEITDEVRYLIDQMNADNVLRDRRVAHLDIITMHGLLHDFLAAQGQFLPTTFSELGMLLDVYNAAGTDFVPVHRVFRFFEHGLFTRVGGTKQEARNAVAASVISTGYLLQSFQRSNNAYAVFEGWTTLAGCMIQYAYRSGLRSEDWHDSLALVRTAIDAALQDLWAEVVTRTNFLEGNELVDGAEIYRARVTIMLGALSAYALNTPGFDGHDRLRALVLGNRRYLWLWGESAFPYLFSIIKYLEHAGEHHAGIELLTVILQGTANAFANPAARELAPPYYSAERILRAMVNDELDELESSGGSFILRPILHMLARRTARDRIATHWKQVSKVPVREVRTTDTMDLFSWRMAQATNVTEILPRTQSWAALQQEANQPSIALDALAEYRHILHYFILVCPHRATPDVMRVLDSL
ncbi:MAG: hypothetical protein WBL65_18235 [Bryobacteraceae bacterium]